MLNTQIPRFNARLRDPFCGDVDLPTPFRRGMSPRKQLLQPTLDRTPKLAAKPRHSDATANVVAPYWPNKSWFQELYMRASQTPTRDLFFSGTRAGVVHPAGASWSFG
jgi:hypothetical protein